MNEHVRANHPQLFPVYEAFPKNVMRADVFRYVVMHDLGGLYCDLDYEFLRPYPYGDAQLVLSEEVSSSRPDGADGQIANYVFASAPGHLLWKDMLDDLIGEILQRISTIDDIIPATGPGFLTRIFLANRQKYEGVVVHEKPAFSPFRIRGRNEREILLDSGRPSVCTTPGAAGRNAGVATTCARRRRACCAPIVAESRVRRPPE